MTEAIGAGGSGAYPTKEHAMQAAADRIGKKEAHAMTEHYYKPVGAGDGMGTVVVDEEGMRAELTAARARIAELEAALGTAQTDLAAQRERHAFIAENVAYPSALPSYPAGAFETACELIAREIETACELIAREIRNTTP